MRRSWAKNSLLPELGISEIKGPDNHSHRECSIRISNDTALRHSERDDTVASNRCEGEKIIARILQDDYPGHIHSRLCCHRL